ncbi:MAG: siderophore-interacting protein [Pseudomonadota bacterium]
MNAPTKPQRVSTVMDVTGSRYITPHVIRVTLTAPEAAVIPASIAGGHCKVMLPSGGQSRQAFADQFKGGPKPITRTYTIRHARPEACEIDIDFVAHGDEGPASAWAARAKPGDFLGFAGPGLPKLTAFDADFYLFAADMSAIPVVAAAIEALPQDAVGLAVFETIGAEDRQDISAPLGITQHWLIQSDPHIPSTAQIAQITSLPWPAGRVKTVIAGETGVVRALRLFLRGEKGLDRSDVYASGYWRIGLAEDEHQTVKRAEADADEAMLAEKTGRQVG